jgi:hypothetical protein
LKSTRVRDHQGRAGQNAAEVHVGQRFGQDHIAASLQRGLEDLADQRIGVERKDCPSDGGFSGKAIALEIDAIEDRLEVVLKPLQGLLSNARGYAGTTLMGDGRVLLVLDLKEILP